MERQENIRDTCVYDRGGEVLAVVNCFNCGAPLCNSCGLRDATGTACCNACYSDGMDWVWGPGMW